MITPIRLTALVAIIAPFLLPTHSVHAQAADSSLGYFPLAVGNRWQYAYTWKGVGVYGRGHIMVQVTDTIHLPDGNLYFVVTSQPWPMYDQLWHAVQYLRVDSASGAVLMIVPPDMTVQVRQRLRCVVKADSGQESDRRWIGCLHAVPDTVLGVVSVSKGNDLHNYWIDEDYMYGLGQTRYQRYDNNSDPFQSDLRADLVYARVDGREYGSAQGVDDADPDVLPFDLSALPSGAYWCAAWAGAVSATRTYTPPR